MPRGHPNGLQLVDIPTPDKGHGKLPGTAERDPWIAIEDVGRFSEMTLEACSFLAQRNLNKAVNFRKGLVRRKS